MAIDPESTRAARQVGGRPQFLVLFDHPSELNAVVMAEAVGLTEVPGDADMPGKRMLTRSDGSPAAKVFHNLAAAAARLTAAEAAALDARPGVNVVPIEIRRVPPHRVRPVEDEEESGDEVRSASSRGSSSDEGRYATASVPARTDLGEDPVLSYVLGVRDMADLLISRIRDAPVSARGTGLVEASAGGAYSWCLSMLGVGPNVRWRGDGVKVAVLDTGVDLNHPELAQRLRNENVRSFVPGATAQDGDGHGTHCCGVVGAAIPARGRRYSVAPECTLLVGKVLADDGRGYDDWILDGMQWAADRGARVISMSLGSERGIDEPHDPAYEQIAATLLQQGIVVVSAAGNSSDRPRSTSPVENPAACPSLLSVAAVDRSRVVADFSCCQMDFAAVDISAPGVAVYSAFPGGRHVYMDGTSMAAPHVAGLLALLLEQLPQSSGTALWDLLRQRARAGGRVEDFGAGIAHM